MIPKHILSARQFEVDELTELFKKADEMKLALATSTRRRLLANKHRGQVVATLFYEPSTRTRLSFESAAAHLGINVIGTENAHEFSSAVKGETLEDSIRVISDYVDLIILRHPETGAAARAAKVSRVPVINGGDGGQGQHPTQSLLDLYTIFQELGTPDGKTVVLSGALKYYRPSRSLATVLALYHPAKVILVSPPTLKIQTDIKNLLLEADIPVYETENFSESIKQADILYQNRIPKEYFSDPQEYSKYKSQYILDSKKVATMRQKSIIMHPLPRVDEIHPDVDQDQRAAYFRQANNGLYIRMALIDSLLAP